MDRRESPSEHGFTLVEVLITMVVMSVVAMAAYSINESMLKTSHGETEVTDAQNSLRRALHGMTRDIRLAGFMVTGDPIINNSASDLTIRTAAVTNVFARVTNNFTASGTDTFQVALDSMASRFRAGDAVRIIRPPLLFEPDPTLFQVSSVGTAQLTISGLTAGISFQQGDIIVKTRPGAPLVTQIRYFVDAGNNLVRQVNGVDQQLVPHVSEMEFLYQLDDDGLVKRIDITLTATSDPRKDAFIGTKTKSLQTTITLRNV